jgi:hypothetical protein
VSSDYSKLVALSAMIAASIWYKSRMDVLMKEAEMYFVIEKERKPWRSWQR